MSAPDKSVHSVGLVTAYDVSKILSVPRLRIYDLARTGQIPSVRIGRTIRFDPERIKAWIAAGGTAATDGHDVH